MSLPRRRAQHVARPVLRPTVNAPSSERHSRRWPASVAQHSNPTPAIENLGADDLRSPARLAASVAFTVAPRAGENEIIPRCAASFGPATQMFERHRMGLVRSAAPRLKKHSIAAPMAVPAVAPEKKDEHLASIITIAKVTSRVRRHRSPRYSSSATSAPSVSVSAAGSIIRQLDCFKLPRPCAPEPQQTRDGHGCSLSAFAAAASRGANRRPTAWRLPLCLSFANVIGWN